MNKYHCSRCHGRYESRRQLPEGQVLCRNTNCDGVLKKGWR